MNKHSHYATVSAPEFCRAHALFIALESKGIAWMSPEALLLVGEARAAFTDHDARRPAEYVDVEPATAADGLTELAAALGLLAEQEAALPEVLCYTRAQDLIMAAAT